MFLLMSISNFIVLLTFNVFFDARNTDTQIILMCCYCSVVGILALMVTILVS
jgi:hypothetical protein